MIAVPKRGIRRNSKIGLHLGPQCSEADGKVQSYLTVMQMGMRAVLAGAAGVFFNDFQSRLLIQLLFS